MTKLKSKNTSSSLTIIAMGVGLSALAACSSSGIDQAPTPGAVRASGETAPADLQLICASKAAEQLQITDENILPVSSAPIGDTVYQVNLAFHEGQAVCVIDNQGIVQSINRS